MKKRFLITTLLLSLIIVMANASIVFATLPDEGYGYTIKVYAGEQGHFEDPSVGKVSDKGKTITIEVKQDAALTINESTTGFVLDNNDYYVRGFREAGHDNDELIAAFPSVDSDASYEVAYGLRGGMVKYTVRYLDAAGEPLQDDEDFYGMAGDKPVVSFRYIDGYQPQAYNLTKTLSSNEEENVFEFKYSTSKTRTETVTETINGGANAAGTEANNADAVNNNANAADAAQADNAPADVVDLDDGDTPLTDGTDLETTDLVDSKTPKHGVNPFAIGAGIAAVAALGCIGFAVTHLRRREEEGE